MSKDYKVGNGRPPLHSRFKPGQSGNPKGRPKGIKRPHELVRKILLRKVNIREGGSQRRVTGLEAMLLGLANKAMKGDHKAAEFLLGFLDIHDANSMSQSGDADARASAEEFTQRMLQLMEKKLQQPNERPEK